MKLNWRHFLIGLLLGTILGGLLLFFIIRIPYRRPMILIPSPLSANGDHLSIESIRGNEGKINLNTADVEELATLPGIGSVKAQSIVEFREKYGAFQNIDELLYITGIGKSLLAEIEDLIYVE